MLDTGGHPQYNNKISRTSKPHYIVLQKATEPAAVHGQSAM